MRWFTRKLSTLVLGFAVVGGAMAGDGVSGGLTGQHRNPTPPQKTQPSPKGPQKSPQGPQRSPRVPDTRWNGSRTPWQNNRLPGPLPSRTPNNSNKFTQKYNLKDYKQSMKPTAAKFKGRLPASFQGWSKHYWSKSCKCWFYCNPLTGWWYYYYGPCNCYVPCGYIDQYPPTPCPDDTTPPPGPDNSMPPPDNTTPGPDNTTPGPDNTMPPDDTTQPDDLTPPDDSTPPDSTNPPDNPSPNKKDAKPRKDKRTPPNDK